MKRKSWIGIAIGILILIITVSIVMGIERHMTEKTLLEKKVSAQEVQDTTPPVIILKGNRQITMKQGERYQEPGYSAMDDTDGSIVGRVVVSRQTVNNKQYKIIYRVSDKSGNMAQEERIINIEDPDIIKQANLNGQINANNNTQVTENNEITANDKKQNITTNNINNTVANNVMTGNIINNDIVKDSTNNTISNNQNDKNANNDYLNNVSKQETSINKNTNKNNNTNTSNNSTTKNSANKAEDSKGVIYLTFDDGPTNSSTPQILDILKKHNVKATFFILNYNSNTEALVKREVREGHSVGIHGYSHDYKKIYTSEEAYMANLDKLQAKIYKSTGVKTTITRFPGGSSNTISKFNPGIMTRLSKLIVQKGYTYYDWNVDSNDAGGARNAEAVYKNVTKSLSKKWRNIVLMHDFAGNKKTIDALEKIIEYGKKNGYTFKPITADTPMMKHGINN